MTERERPSQHGALLGQALAVIAERGRMDLPALPDCCSTCAFKPDCMTNQMGATGLTALNCMLGLDTDRFACHHGMKDGEPKKLCMGYVAAMMAPYEFKKEVLQAFYKKLDELPKGEPDKVRVAFDAWLDTIDPERKMNDYELGRKYEIERHARKAAEPANG